MKLLLQDTGGFKLYAELRPIPALKNKEHELKFTTVWEGARGDVEEHVSSQFILTDAAVENLKKVICGY